MEQEERWEDIPIVGLGLINKDIVAVVPEWERDAKVAASYYFEQVGGPVPVALMALARFGISGLHFIGTVGADREGEDLAALITAEGIMPHLAVASGISSSRSIVLLDARDGSRTLANYAEALPPLTLTPSHRALLASARLLHLDGRDLPASLAAAEIFRQTGGLISLDLGTMRPDREKLIAQCHIVIASRRAGAVLFPLVAKDPMRQVQMLLEMGLLVAGVTLGHAGVIIGEQGHDPIHVPGYRVSGVVDTCGAGDLFHGAFLWAYLKGRDLLSCTAFAQAAVAVRIRRYGNQDGLPCVADVEEFRTTHG
jgi:sugar/nucleoside kinase (ribokinase family)